MSHWHALTTSKHKVSFSIFDFLNNIIKRQKSCGKKKSATLRVIVEIQTENDFFILLAYFAVGQEWCETKIYEIF